jgi:polyisoprenoid-binding protein YceI
MMPAAFTALVLLASGVAQSASIGASQIVLDLNPAETEIRFTLGDVLHTVHGGFRLKSGTVRFDPATGAASGSVIVDVASGASGSAARDRKMHKEVLESRLFPEAVFTPDRVEGHLVPEGAAELQVHGRLEIHGGEHELVFETHVESRGHELIATMHAVLPYVQWGLKNPSTFLLRVNDKVQLDIRTTAHARRE